MATEAPKKDNPKNSGLKKTFTALVDRKQVNLDLEVLKLMLKHELLVNMDSLDENLSSLMPFMLVSYIKNWPGWQRSKEYYSGKLNFREWYEKFRQYIVVRLNFLIKNGYNQAIDMIREDRKNESNQLNPNRSFQEHGTQTDYLAPKGLAPFAISIQCPPKVLSSLVFTDSGDDIIMRQHPDLPWIPIGILELINWPHIGVEFLSPELSFKRYNRSEYVRFLNLTNSPLVHEKPDFIEQVEILDPSNGRNCYTLKLLQSYANQYIDILKSVNKVSQSFVENVEVIIGQFLKDVEEIDMNNTMASNTSVLFNIGRSTFVRNKKISKGNTSLTGSKVEVGYSETFVPKMETHLNYFKGVQDISTSEVTFSYLNILKKMLASNTDVAGSTWAPVLVFHCLFCNTQYNTHTGILKHLEHEHRIEPNFMCVKCMKPVPISSLAKIRWKHVCKNNQASTALGRK
ncbi:hypothetical protein JTB14_010671 [Gonioctena quinquepunctata]|nr:hypothetical protein JTB14_010671 [Gonioctena quinquepunctata]